MRIRTSDKKVYKNFRKKGVDVRVYKQTVSDTTFRYIESGLDKPNVPLVIFVHGAPGSSDSFDDYLQDSILLTKARLVSVDRLGYGYSEFGKAEISIQKQTQIIEEIVQQKEYSKLILVGHSFGGPIITRYLMDYPGKAEGVVMLAPAISPDDEKILKIAYLAKWKVTRTLFTPKVFCVAADEKFSHADQLRLMVDNYSAIKDCKVIHIHGDRDPIVPFANLAFAKKKFINCEFHPVPLEGVNHFIPWNSKPTVMKHILPFLED